MIIQNGIKEGMSAEEIQRSIKGYLNEPHKLFRRVRNKETGELEWSDAAKRYKPGQGVYRSAYRNAMRLARTEINAAYRQAQWEQYQNDPTVVGIRIELSNNHTTLVNGVPVPFYDICDELRGVYPKSFKWTGWHPQCYSDDSLVLTKRGWLLFDDVRDDDLIFSLNPATRQPEWVGIVAKQKYYRKGEMIHFHNRSLDCLVTPDHEMVYIKNGAIKRKEADVFSSDDGAFLTMRENIAEFDKETVQYDGFVYDLTLERNHIMYIQRNGKCFWGSNCRCQMHPVLMSDEEYRKLVAAENEGKQYTPKQITKMPKAFDEWIKENMGRIDRANNRGTLPLWLKKNVGFTNIKINPINDAHQVEIRKEAWQRYNSHSSLYEKAYFDKFSGGYNVYHKAHQFAEKGGGGEAEKTVGKILAKYNGKQVEFLPEGFGKGADVGFDGQSWDIKFINDANEATIRTYIKDARKAENAIFYWESNKDKMEELRSAVIREVGRMRKLNRLSQMPDIYYIDEENRLRTVWKK